MGRGHSHERKKREIEKINTVGRLPDTGGKVSNIAGCNPYRTPDSIQHCIETYRLWKKAYECGLDYEKLEKLKMFRQKTANRAGRLCSLDDVELNEILNHVLDNVEVDCKRVDFEHAIDKSMNGEVIQSETAKEERRVHDILQNKIALLWLKHSFNIGEGTEVVLGKEKNEFLKLKGLRIDVYGFGNNKTYGIEVKTGIKDYYQG